MAARAARISAATLNERLPVGNSHDELGRLATVINDLLGRVDVAFRKQQQFVADASHELRTPIAIARGEADVTLQRSVREESEYREALAIVANVSTSLTCSLQDCAVCGPSRTRGACFSTAISPANQLIPHSLWATAHCGGGYGSICSTMRSRTRHAMGASPCH